MDSSRLSDSDAAKATKGKSNVGEQSVGCRKKSGRFWKSERDRFRSVIKSKGLKQTFEKRQRQKETMTRVRELQQSLKAEQQRQRDDLRARQEENKKRREANAKKADVVQVIKNPAKLKKMKKKQLRLLAKRDTTTVVK